MCNDKKHLLKKGKKDWKIQIIESNILLYAKLYRH